MNADAYLQPFLPDAIAAGERALDRALNPKTPDGCGPVQVGLGTMCLVTPATLVVLLEAAQQYLGARPDPAGEA